MEAGTHALGETPLPFRWGVTSWVTVDQWGLSGPRIAPFRTLAQGCQEAAKRRRSLAVVKARLGEHRGGGCRSTEGPRSNVMASCSCRIASVL